MKRIFDPLIENGVFGPAAAIIALFFLIAVFHGEWLAFFSVFAGVLIASYYLATRT